MEPKNEPILIHQVESLTKRAIAIHGAVKKIQEGMSRIHDDGKEWESKEISERKVNTVVEKLDYIENIIASAEEGITDVVTFLGELV